MPSSIRLRGQKQCVRFVRQNGEMTQGVPQADGRIAVEPTMDVDEVAAAVVHMAGLPLWTNVLTMTIMVTKMPYVGRE